MPRNFWNALNPTSKNSEIDYFLSGDYPAKGKQMIDRTVLETIHQNWNKKDVSTFEFLLLVLIGNHYDIMLKGRNSREGGNKGVLDFSIYPLFCRKLVADRFSPQAESNLIKTALVLLIAVPSELTRMSAGIVLSLLLLPFALVISALSNGVSEPQASYQIPRN